MSETAFHAKANIPGAAPLHEVSAAEFRKVAENRRSVRVYDATPVPEAVMRDCLDLALLAPNSSNLQPWEFYWVRSAEKKAKLVEYCFSQNAARTAAELVVAVARIDTVERNRRQMLAAFEEAGNTPRWAKDYYGKLVRFAYGRGPLSVLAPFKWAFLNAAGLFRVVPREPIGKSDMQLWAAKTTALACENFMLAAASHGFDTCPMEGLDSKRVKKLLGVSRSSIVVMGISVGKRKPDGVYGARMRFPKEQFLHEI